MYHYLKKRFDLLFISQRIYWNSYSNTAGIPVPKSNQQS